MPPSTPLQPSRPPGWGKRQDWLLSDVLSFSSSYTATSNGVTYVMFGRLMDTVEMAGFKEEDVEHILRDVWGEREGYEGLKEGASAFVKPPVLYNWSMGKSGGGWSGKVRGMLGVSDGTDIVTGEVVGWEDTLPNYVTTRGGGVFELGEEYGREGGLKGGVEKGMTLAVGRGEGGEQGVKGDLAKLAVWTTGFLSAAGAVGAIGHHLTVNVFWV
ncbi:hypothetical protein TrCOL_g3989 [Triparma columacea]|uniref:Uncharacterized protein n=1 Tax=Triparma columacea TaxID=722753 RepID=A0A9W7GNY6_9STRA|nr:hypothetical protein TrCOL_g3989 [Triparma columacea]